MNNLPAWMPPSGTAFNALSVGSCAYLYSFIPRRSINSDHIVTISAVSNLVAQAIAPIFAKLLYGENASQHQLLKAYVLSHIVAVPFVSWWSAHYGLKFS